jgi:ribonucleoside-diphosphate reductase alpha chain
LAAVTASNDMAKERYNGMRELIILDFDFPEYYDMNFAVNDTNINKIYHQLKPCKYELNKDPTSTTIGAYSTFDGSPMSKGLFQFDMWNLDHNNLHYKDQWKTLRESVKLYGVRNSMLTALMPTASTSQILGNNECFEFFTSNIYSRKTQAGTFTLVNKYLVNDLISLNMWNKEMKDTIIAMNGSIQNIFNIPAELKALYKTMWEIKQSWVLKAAAARGPFVDQTQSMNIFMAEPDYIRLGSSHFWGWKNGLKTGMYYLRTKPATDAIKFTIDPKLVKDTSDCTNCSA